MRNRFGAAALCVTLTAVLYAAAHGEFAQVATSLSSGTSSLLRAFGVHNAATATVAPDQPIQSLAGELPTHDPTVGRLAGSAGTAGGEATYSIPIALPPGRGVQPSISLEYNSRAGNGIAGMGWSLSGLSSLQRCPATIEQDGMVAPVSLTDSDKLCLDGQRLVATAGTYGLSGTTYDTEVESFVRVTQLGGDLQSANTYFKVETKSGDILWYGNNSVAANAARVVQGGVTVPLTWMLARKEDRVGNFMRYSYTNYTNGEVLLTDIFYTGFGTTDGDRSAHFVYQARPTGATDSDVTYSYLAGGVTAQTQRLSVISTWSGASSNANNEVREYRLAYNPTTSQSTHRSLLASVADCAFLSGKSACRPPTTFTWQQGPLQSTFHPATLPGGHTIYGLIGDLDGDGSREVLADGGASIASLNADRSIKSIMQLPSGFTSTDQFELQSTGNNTDFDRDGRDDLVGFNGNEIMIYFWDGPHNASTFAQAFTRSWDTGIQASTTRPAALGSPWLVYVGDVDGDGRPDIVLERVTKSTADPCAAQLEVYRNIASTTGGPQAPATFSLASTTCLAGVIVVGLANSLRGFRVCRISMAMACPTSCCPRRILLTSRTPTATSFTENAGRATKWCVHRSAHCSPLPAQPPRTS